MTRPRPVRRRGLFPRLLVAGALALAVLASRAEAAAPPAATAAASPRATAAPGAPTPVALPLDSRRDALTLEIDGWGRVTVRDAEGVLAGPFELVLLGPPGADGRPSALPAEQLHPVAPPRPDGLGLERRLPLEEMLGGPEPQSSLGAPEVERRLTGSFAGGRVILRLRAWRLAGGGVLLDYRLNLAGDCRATGTLLAAALDPARLPGCTFLADTAAYAWPSAAAGGRAAGTLLAAPSRALRLEWPRGDALCLLRETPTEVFLIRGGPVAGEPAGLPEARLVLAGAPLPPPPDEPPPPTALPPGGIVAVPPPGRPRSTAFALYLGARPYAGAPVLLEAWPPPAEAAAGASLELPVRLFGAWTSPYASEEIALDLRLTAEGEKAPALSRPGFYFQDFRMELPAPPPVAPPTPGAPAVVVPTAPPPLAETLYREGEPYWLVRLTPETAGEQRWELVAAGQAGAARLEGRLKVLPADPHGPGARGRIGLSARDRRYFAYADGTPYFPLGLNLAWGTTEGGLPGYLARLDRLQAARANYARLWSATWWCPLEGARLDDYSQDEAWRLDYLFAAAAERGLALQFCLENAHDLTYNQARLPYFAAAGGPCRSADEFFADARARAAFRHQLRYLVARYGDSRGLFAWELGNELDLARAAAEESPAELAARLERQTAWAREMAEHLRREDGARHLISLSLSRLAGQEKLAALPELDFVQIHAYLPPPDRLARQAELDEVRFVTEGLDAAARAAQAVDVEHAPRPVLLAEFGFAPTGEGGAPDSTTNAEDPTGVHFHNALWGAALSGAAGSAMLWWWEPYVERQQLYYHLRSLADFLRPLDLAAAEPVRVVSEPNDPVRVVGLRGRRLAALWFQNPESTWVKRVLEKAVPSMLREYQLTLGGFDAGAYAIEWWDTHGDFVLTAERQTVGADGRLKLRIPDFTTDLACRVQFAATGK